MGSGTTTTSSEVGVPLLEAGVVGVPALVVSGVSTGSSLGMGSVVKDGSGVVKDSEGGVTGVSAEDETELTGGVVGVSTDDGGVTGGSSGGGEVGS